MNGRRCGALAAAWGAPACALGQGELSVIREIVDVRYILYSIGSVALLIVAILVLLVIKKLKLRRETDAMESAVAFGDLSGLKSKGLMTDEELKKVRAAMAKQVISKLDSAPTGKAPALGAASLLMADPDVQRLEELARQKGLNPDLAEEPGGTEEAGIAGGSGAEDDIPPQVMDLFKQGLITEEELQKIRERARRQNQG